MSESEARVTDLELRFMTLERFVQELSGVVAEQGRALDALVAETKRLRGQLAAKEEEAGDDKPPHY